MSAEFGETTGRGFVGGDEGAPGRSARAGRGRRSARAGESGGSGESGDRAQGGERAPGGFGGGRRRSTEPPEPPKKPAEAARAICLRLLNDRPRTRAELATALTRRAIPDEIAAEVLDRFDEVGLIDDAAFAAAWVESRHHGRGLARRALAQELRRKGVDSELVDEALDTLDPETEEATARALVQRKLRTVTGPPEAVLRKVVGALARKGYAPGLAFRVVKEALEAMESELAESMDPDALEDSYLGES